MNEFYLFFLKNLIINFCFCRLYNKKTNIFFVKVIFMSSDNFDSFYILNSSKYSFTLMQNNHKNLK